MSQILWVIHRQSQISEIIESKTIKKIILRFHQLTVQSFCAIDNFNHREILPQLEEAGISVFVEVHQLVIQKDFLQVKEHLDQLIKLGYRRFMVLDMGVLHYLQNCQIPLELHLILHAAQANFPWLEKIFSHPYLRGVVVSPQTPHEVAVKWKEHLSVNCTFGRLVLGQVNLLYTPRHVLSERDPQSVMTAKASSKEALWHQNFKVWQGPLGAVLLSSKILCLIDEEYSKIVFYQHQIYDCPEIDSVSDFLQLTSAESQIDYIKRCTGREIFRGNFHHNKTTHLFPKLKNEHLLQTKEAPLARIISVEKGKLLLARILKNFSIHSLNGFKIQTPEGKSFDLTAAEIQGCQLLAEGRIRDITSQEDLQAGDLLLVPYKKGAPVMGLILPSEHS